MSLVLTAALLLQGSAPAPRVPAPRADTTSSTGISVGVTRQSLTIGVSAPRRSVPRATDADRRTAFADSASRTLLLRAREARRQQDSTLRSYDVTSYQRLSLGLSLRPSLRDRLAYRSEGAAQVRWERGRGAHVRVLGARMAVPMAEGTDGGREAEAATDLADVMAIPYYPGMDELWLYNMFGNGNDDSEEEPEEGMTLIHPLAEDAEATYRYSVGDSMALALPGGRQIRLRELRAIPRRPQWNAVAASLWFELDEAHLVRAVLRFSDRLDVWELAESEDSTARDEVPLFVKGLVTPLELDLTAMTVEYGLYEGRFWLPRLQGAEFAVRMGAIRAPMTIDQRFRYESVNGAVEFPPLTNVVSSSGVGAYRDSLRAAGIPASDIPDSLQARRARRDTAEVRAREAQCAAGDRERVVRSRYQGVRMPVILDLPCDRSTLATSEALPPSIYDPAEALFGKAERDELVAMLNEVLPRGTLPTPPRVTYGLGLTRYNRVEGLGTGLGVEKSLGSGWRTGANARLALGDRRLNGEWRIARDQWGAEWELATYKRLAVSSDLGDPLSVGASFAALLYGRDEGFYHRATGIEAIRRPIAGRGFELRAFTEQHREAPVVTAFSLFGGATDPRMGPNTPVEVGRFTGMTARWQGSAGLDPRGWRGALDVRAEGATGRTEVFLPPIGAPICRGCLPEETGLPDGRRTYGRFVADATLSKGLGPVAIAVNAVAGTSSGPLPAQRAFFLGGLRSVRGLSAGTAVGDAMWLVRSEIGANVAAVRPVLFTDIGWAGPRAEWRTPATTLRGAGVGLSVLDGLFRVELSRGLAPVRQTRFDLSLEARF